MVMICLLLKFLIHFFSVIMLNTLKFKCKCVQLDYKKNELKSYRIRKSETINVMQNTGLIKKYGTL